MNTRSIRFRLAAWHTLLLTGIFVVLGGVLYFQVRSHLQATILDLQARRADQIAHTLIAGPAAQGDAGLGDRIEALYAPERSDRFFRVTNRAGQVVYASGEPADESFDSRSVPTAPAGFTTGRVTLPDGRAVLVAAVRAPSIPGPGSGYLVEVGASSAPVDLISDRLLRLLALCLPLVVVAVWAGGYLLVRLALKPVTKIAGKAAIISQHNLSERLPVADTGDELERLSESLNHMIARLDDAFTSSKRFVADASHELRTPFTIIRGELEALAQDADTPAGIKEQAGSLLEEVERLSRIVDQLFALSRLDVGEAQAEWLPVDLGELATATADQMALLAADRNIALSVEASPDVKVFGDRSRLKQIVVNLLDNAIKYTPREGKVVLAVHAAEGFAFVVVTDTGIGIDPTSLPHVFERFYRDAQARATHTDGAGLGLAIIKAIALAHDGEVSVESAPGQGSRFQVRLPLAGSSG